MKETYDNQFSQIENLKWNPFIGDQFDNEKSLLIIGESHYHDGSQASMDNVDKNDWSRTMVDDSIEGTHTSLFKPLFKLLSNNENISLDPNQLWSKSAFYNFIQNPMGGVKHRPAYEDFYKSCYVFFDIIKLLKPSKCLFLGVAAYQAILDVIDEEKYPWEIKYEKYIDKINGTFPRKLIISGLIEKPLELHFIKHSSSRFTPDLWRDHLLKDLPKEMSYLADK